MARALGPGPTSVLEVRLDHEGIDRTLGARRDRTRETTAVMRFVRVVVSAAR